MLASTRGGGRRSLPSVVAPVAPDGEGATIALVRATAPWSSSDTRRRGRAPGPADSPHDLEGQGVGHRADQGGPTVRAAAWSFRPSRDWSFGIVRAIEPRPP